MSARSVIRREPAAGLLIVALLATSGAASAQGKPTPPAPPAAPAPAPAAPAAPPPDGAPPAPPPGGTPAAPAAPSAPKSTDGEEKAAPDPQKRAEAEASFKRGLELLAQDAWQAALAEFLRSRELFPTRTATNNAAFCLRKLNRFDEALDMYEALLREYPDVSQDKKEAAQKEVAELRGLVGTIDIVGAEPGSSIVVDGRPRPDYPLIDPLRVSAGTHSVRLFREGFRPFETRIDVAGGQTVKITAKMAALAASGRLRVAEASGKTMDVVIGGAVVGVTPWEGSLAVGDQVVWLSGDGDLGTQPARVPVKKGDVSTVTLAAEPLEAGILVQATPPGATIRIDSVEVGRGVFEGRFRRGEHVVEALAEGFYPQKKRVGLERGDAEKVVFALERDEDAEAWRKPSHIMIDVSGGVTFVPSFGGDVSSSCGDGCTADPGAGGMVVINGAYEFGSGLSFGLTGGFIQFSQTVEKHDETLVPVGIDGGLGGTATDELRLRGALLGIHAGYGLLDGMPIRFRLGAGALIGSVRSERSGRFNTRSGADYDAPALESEASTAYVYVAPEVSIGQPFGDIFELDLFVQGLGLIAASEPKWGSDGNPTVNVPGDGLSGYSADQSLASHMFIIVPGMSGRFSF